jgi:hypothetical protein
MDRQKKSNVVSIAGRRRGRHPFPRATGRGDRSYKGTNWLKLTRSNILLALSVIVIMVSAWALILRSPWPVTTLLRHLLAGPTCAAARGVGLAPARRGEPGYYDRHDADQDGIACEPYSGR